MLDESGKTLIEVFKHKKGNMTFSNYTVDTKTNNYVTIAIFEKQNHVVHFTPQSALLQNAVYNYFY